MIAFEPTLRSAVRQLRHTRRRAMALLPDLWRGLGVAMLAVVVLSFLAALAFKPFMLA